MKWGFVSQGGRSYGLGFRLGTPRFSVHYLFRLVKCGGV